MQVQAAARRRAAAEWVEGLTGIALPTSSDHAFRGALRDGVLLCRILDLLRPGMVAKVGPVLASPIQYMQGAGTGGGGCSSCLPSMRCTRASTSCNRRMQQQQPAMVVWEFLTPTCCRWQGLKAGIVPLATVVTATSDLGCCRWQTRKLLQPLPATATGRTSLGTRQQCQQERLMGAPLTLARAPQSLVWAALQATYKEAGQRILEAGLWSQRRISSQPFSC